jgi:hypothetical protein
MDKKQYTERMIRVATRNHSEYQKLAGTLLKAESISKTRRYGEISYKKQFIQHPDKVFSSYMNTFLYLRRMEDSYEEIREIYSTNLLK